MGGEFNAFSSASRWIMLPSEQHPPYQLTGEFNQKNQMPRRFAGGGGMGGFGIDWYITVVVAV